MATQTINMSTDSARILAHTPDDTSYFLRGDNTWSNILESKLTLQEDNDWLTPAVLQLLRDDAAVYSDRAVIGVTNGNLHLDAYQDSGLYLNCYSSTGNVYFNGSTYYINGGTYNGNAASATKARYVEGDNDAATPAGALLRSGNGRQDASPSGDTWIYFDSLSGSTYWGIRHQQANNTIDFFGGGSVTSSIALQSGAANFTQIAIPNTSVQSAATSMPTALSYGRLQSYGNLFINGNTDNSGTEYVVITAGHGVSSSTADGLTIGQSAVWSNHGPIHIFPKAANNYNEGIRCHASSGNWTTIVLCDSANTSDSGTSTNTWGIFNNGGTFYITKNGSSSGPFGIRCNSEGWRFNGGTVHIAPQNTSSEGGEIFLEAAPSYGYYAALDAFQNRFRVHSNGGERFWCRLDTNSHSDYAELCTSKTNEPGRVYQETNECILIKTQSRLIPGCSVISDTYGACINGNDPDGSSVAVGGRVLCYPYQPRENYQAGMAVCSAPNGTVDIMTREEIKEYPDAILGYVAGIPDENKWRKDDVILDGRIWIRLA